MSLLSGWLEGVATWWTALPDEARNLVLGVAATVIAAPVLWVLARPFVGNRIPEQLEAPPSHPVQAQPHTPTPPLDDPAPSPTKRPPQPAAALETLDQLDKRIAELTEPGGFFGREPDTARLDDFIARNERGLILVTGAGGIGKSALLANWAEARRASGARVARHFFSLRYPATRAVIDAYKALLVQLHDALGIDGTIPEEERPLREALFAALQSDATADAPLIVIIDALDEADAAFPALASSRLGQHVYLLVSERVEADGEPDRLAPWLREDGRVPYPVTRFPLGPLAIDGVVDWLRGKLDTRNNRAMSVE